MNEREFSNDAEKSLWNSVLKLKPSLRRKITVVGQVFRGSQWYLLQDQNSGRFIRVNASAYDLIGRFDGVHSVAELLDSISELDPDRVFHPDQIIGVFAQLNDFEALECGLPIGLNEALRRYEHSRKQKWHQRFGNLLSLRFSLIDPDGLLNTLAPLGRWALSSRGLLAWSFILLSALTVVTVNYDSLMRDVKNQSFSATDFLTYALLYCVIKALHELGHGLAIKRWGGEVRDAGISLLVFMPVPYVDGSASLAFRDKRKRAIVSAAGILVELLLAAIAVLIWSLTEPSVVNDLALKVMLIGGLSTLLYNGNPLLRFDGYFVLEDLVEIPNLASRSSRYYLYLIQRYLLGFGGAVSPVFCEGERKWFLAYGFLSPVYRTLILFGIAIFLAQHYFVVGVILASVALYNQLIKPALAAVKYVIVNAQHQTKKWRSAVAIFIPIGLIAALLSAPVPLITRTQGVVWVDDNAQIVAEAGGVITSVGVASGNTVKPGDTLLQLSNPELESKLQILKLKQTELRTNRAIAQQKSRVDGENASLDHDMLTKQIRLLEADREALTIRSAADGVLVFNDPHELIGKFVEEGDLLGFVVQKNQSTIRTVINQGSVGKLNSGIQTAEIMLASQMGTVYNASVIRDTPAGDYSLPSAALSKAFGGPIRTDPTDGSGLAAESEFFQIDLAMSDDAFTDGLGGRVFVKLYHGHESLFRQWWRQLQQLVLARLTL